MGDKEYTFMGILGEGGYGEVYKARRKSTGDFVAVKVPRDKLGENGIQPRILREIAILNMLSGSDYIVRLHGVEIIGGRLCLCFEFLHSDLKTLIKSQPLPPPQIKKYMYQLCRAVDHFHGLGVLHRDLKPQNVLFDRERDILKIADFGLGRAFTIPNRLYTPQVGTPWYKAPELLLGSEFHYTGLDMWSLGCIFAEMSTGRPLFPSATGQSDMHPNDRQLLCIFRLLGTPAEEDLPGVGNKIKLWPRRFLKFRCQDLAPMFPSLGDAGVDLLLGMLSYNYAERISAKAALFHPYFAELDQ